jgi:hypothetical protein
MSSTKTKNWNDRLEQLPQSLGFSFIKFRHKTGSFGDDAQLLYDEDDEGRGDLIRCASTTIIGTDDDDKEVTLGEITAQLFFFDDALNAGVDLAQVADGDGEEQAVAGLLQSLYDDADRLLTGGVGVYVQNVFLEPAFRHHDLGYVALKRFLDWHAGNAFAILTFPSAKYFFEEGKLALDPLVARSQTKTGQAKLEAWCSRFGFVKHADKDLPGYWLLPEHDQNWSARSIRRAGHSGSRITDAGTAAIRGES